MEDTVRRYEADPISSAQLALFVVAQEFVSGASRNPFQNSFPKTTVSEVYDFQHKTEPNVDEQLESVARSP
jgi:hypothetical protein